MFLKDGSLRIDNVQTGDAGIYECHASSDAGNASKVMDLIVQGQYKVKVDPM